MPSSDRVAVRLRSTLLPDAPNKPAYGDDGGGDDEKKSSTDAPSSKNPFSRLIKVRRAHFDKTAPKKKSGTSAAAIAVASPVAVATSVEEPKESPDEPSHSRCGPLSMPFDDLAGELGGEGRAKTKRAGKRQASGASERRARGTKREERRK